MGIEIITAVFAGIISLLAKPLLDWFSNRKSEKEIELNRLKITYKYKDTLTPEELKIEIQQLEDLIKKLRELNIAVDKIDLENLNIEIKTEDTSTFHKKEAAEGAGQ